MSSSKDEDVKEASSERQAKEEKKAEETDENLYVDKEAEKSAESGEKD